VTGNERERPHPLFALLDSVQHQLQVENIDRVWIFPPRRREAGETAVVIVAAFLHDDPHRRRVLVARYTAPADAHEPLLAIDEFGVAPEDRVSRVVEEVLERIKDEPATPPRAARIKGQDARWHQLLHDLAQQQLQEAGRDPRRLAEPTALRGAPRPHRLDSEAGGGYD
jgi:hypothetical protein